MEENQYSIYDKEHLQLLTTRIQIQRNEAFNQIALLEAELIKAQKTIEELKKQEK
jgi:hypothetical protein